MLRIIVLGFIATLATPLATQADQAALNTLRERVYQRLVETMPSANAGEYLASQRPDGSWEDVNYGDRARSGWSPAQHMHRVVSMTAAYRTPGNPHHGKEAMRNGVRRGLAYWEQTTPESANPFTRRIGMPIELGRILLLMGDEIDPALRERIIKDMGRVLVDQGRDGYARWGAGGTRRERGPDVVRSAYIHIFIGLLTNDPEAITIASRYIQAEAKVDNNAEGIQPDGSYQTHGPQIYFPGYWQEHIRQTAFWAEVLADTPWAFGPEARDFLRLAILDSAQWVIRRGYYDPFVMGRGIARKAGHRANLDWVEGLIPADPDHADEYRAFLDHIAGRNDASLVGNRHMWLSDYMSHRRENFMLSVRMLSTRTGRQEQGNAENTQNRYLSQGATAILVKGDEYDNIYPVWNWRRIPGTTAPHSTGRGVMQAGNWGGRGTTDFVGAASDGRHGVATMDVDWYDGAPGTSGPEHRRPGRIYAHKNWFFFDREMVALGSGIRYDGQFAPVETTLNQALRTTPVFSARHPAGEGEPETEGATLEGLAWVWHAEVGYVFPHAQRVILRNESQVTGSWRSIHGGYAADAPDNEVTKDRFTLGIDHGDKPDGASYAYIVVPGMSRQQFDEYRKQQDQIRIVANTPVLAAVHHKSQRLTGLVFRDPAAAGTVTVHDTLSVWVSAPSIVLIDESVSPMQITVSAPTEREVTVSLVTPAGQQAMTFQVPGTRSVTQQMN
jgi:chondroitin AC lyase